MPKVKSESYNLKKLSEEQIQELCHKVLSVYSQIIQTTRDYNYFLESMTDKHCFFNRVELGKDDEGRAVGYFHFYVRKISISSGKECAVARSIMGVLPEYRGDNFIFSSALKANRDFFIQYPYLPYKTYFFGVTINPISYHIFCKYTRVIYPCPEKKSSKELVEIYNKLLEVYKFKLITPWICSHPSKVELGEKEKKALQASNSPFVKFYLEKNPNYSQGFAIPVICQAGWTDFGYAVGVRAKDYLQSTFSKKASLEINKENKDTVTLSKPTLRLKAKL